MVTAAGATRDCMVTAAGGEAKQCGGGGRGRAAGAFGMFSINQEIIIKEKQQREIRAIATPASNHLLGNKNAVALAILYRRAK